MLRIFRLRVHRLDSLEPRNEANLEGIMYDPYMADVGVAYCTT